MQYFIRATDISRKQLNILADEVREGQEYDSIQGLKGLISIRIDKLLAELDKLEADQELSSE